MIHKFIFITYIYRDYMSKIFEHFIITFAGTYLADKGDNAWDETDYNDHVCSE